MDAQVTTFTCGGFTLGLMSNHAFMDGHGAAVFLQNLCSIARGKGVVSPPETFSRRDGMKPRMPPSPTFGHPYIASAPGGLQFGTATRFTFSAAALEALRLKGSGQAMKQCSRFQALVALLWTAQAKSAAVAGGNRRRSKEFPIRLPVNLREGGSHADPRIHRERNSSMHGDRHGARAVRELLGMCGAKDQGCYGKHHTGVCAIGDRLRGAAAQSRECTPFRSLMPCYALPCALAFL